MSQAPQGSGSNSNDPSKQTPSPPAAKTYLVIGASRGIGLELCRQLLERQQRVIATARAATGASRLWALTGSENGRNLSILECDVADEHSVGRFVGALAAELGRAKRLSGGVGTTGAAVVGGGGGGGGVGGGANVGIMGGGGGGGEVGWGSRGVIDVCIVNAGVLIYPNRVMELTYAQFSHHLTTNTIGPLLVAAALLKQQQPQQPRQQQSLQQQQSQQQPPQQQPPPPPPSSAPLIPISTLVFMSSDSGSAARFRAFEDGFAAYAASKAALNQGLRHLAAELQRRLEHGDSGSGVGGGASSNSNSSSSGAARERETVVLALHPGEVATDMASGVDAASWEVEGIISPEESVAKMLRVIEDKGKGGAHERGGEPAGVATFWDWEGRPYPW